MTKIEANIKMAAALRESSGPLMRYGLLTYDGSLRNPGFLSSYGSLRWSGFLVVVGSLMTAGFLTEVGSLEEDGFLSSTGSLERRGFLMCSGSPQDGAFVWDPQGGEPMIRVTVELPPDEARALAQFVKRTGFDDCKRLADRHDGGVELDDMRTGLDKLQRALAEAGFAPR
jgi:hypothetical protein